MKNRLIACFSATLIASIQTAQAQEGLSSGDGASTPDINRYVERTLEDNDASVDTTVLQQYLPDEQKLEALERRIAADPANLDLYYSYATQATALKEYEKAAVMYERMLQKAPDLPRIKLELAIVSLRLQRFDKARDLINDALSGQDVPEQVKSNIAPLLQQIADATKTHFFSGTVLTGLYNDSNATSAPDSGIVNINLGGTILPFVLNDEAAKNSDTQLYGLAAINHVYRPRSSKATNLRISWQSNGSVYKNEYDNQDQLNITVVNTRTGPSVTLLDSKLQAALQASYTYVSLDHSSFQHQFGAELNVNYLLDATKRIRLVLSDTLRDYVQSAANPTLNQRDGTAPEIRVGLTYMLDDKNSVDVELSARKEHTRRAYFDNNQYRMFAGYLHQFDKGWFARADMAHGRTDYDAPDLTIDYTTRSEKESEAGVTIGKELRSNVVATVGYQYRRVDANITNYDYDNHRISSNIGVRF